MIKKRTLLFLLIFTVLIIFSSVFKDFISASIFDTFAVSQVTTPTVTLDAYPPDLILDSPTSTNYSTKLIGINYSVSDSASSVDTVWYNLDGGSNTTLTGNTTITVSQRGDYNFYIYANDTVGLVNDTESVTFSVNASRFIEVNFSRFDASPTTNFSALNDSDLEDIENLTLTINSFGKIVFTENINISEDTDLDTHVDISDNNIYINSEDLSNFNKSATLWLYGLTLDDPQILKDGDICPKNICTEVSYSGRTLEFTVTGFTNYSARKTPSVPGATGEAAGGVGSSGSKRIEKRIPEFEINPSLIVVKIHPGETRSQKISIENIGETLLKGVIELSGINEFTILSDYTLELRPGQIKDITAIFTTPITIVPDVYPGRIIVKTEDLTKDSKVIIEVESEKPLFDVNMSIPLKYKRVVAGKKIMGYITLVNKGKKVKVDASLEYIIKDLDGNLVDVKQEMIAVEDMVVLTKDMEVPDILEPGEYVFYVRVDYDDSIAMASDLFTVIEPEEEPSGLAQQLSEILLSKFATVAVALMIMVVLIVVMRKKKGERIRKKKEAPSKQASKEKSFKERLLKKEGDLKKIMDHVRKNLR